MTDNAQRGSSLVEALVALFLLLVSLVGVAPLFVFAMHSGVADADMGAVGATAVKRMEQISAAPYGLLSIGGSLTANKPGYYDNSDPDVLTRWRISATGSLNLKRIEVVAIAKRPTTAPKKIVTLVTVRVKG